MRPMPGAGASLPPPYRAQWESPSLVAQFLAGHDPATDPLWSRSAAANAAEYARWSHHLCGCACLQMALGALGRPIPPIHDLRRVVQKHGGYVEDPDGTIRGLIYAGAVSWLGTQGIPARILLDVTAAGLPALLANGSLVVASVHPSIRSPSAVPPTKGGHLVLVFGVTSAGDLRFHNPSGDTPATQSDARFSPAAFAPFFAARGILIPSPALAGEG